MALLIMAISLNYLLIAGATSATREGQLEVLSEVVSGPARGKPLALHLDSALPEDMQRVVMGLEALLRTPHLIFTSHGQQQASVTGGSSSLSSISSVVLHVVLWLTPRPKLLQELWLHWKPRNLLLFILGPSPGTELLRHEALRGVEKVALIGHFSAETEAFGVYTVLPFSSDGVRLLGPWRREAFASWEDLFPDRFPSFDGYKFHLATVLRDPPFLFKGSSANDRVERGLTVTMLNCFSAKLNFTYTLTADSSDSEWGIIKNGSWTGLLGMIQRKEKIFTVNTLALTTDRVSDFDASELVWMENRRVFLARPLPLPEWLSLSRPFTLVVWAFIFTIFLFVVCFMYIQFKIMSKCGRNNTGGMSGGALCYAGVDTVREQVNALHATGVSWVQLFRAMVCQSAPSLPRALWQRVFLAVWLPYCLVVTAAYTCNLVGIFSHPAYPRRIASMQQLADSSLRIGIGDTGVFTVIFLKEAKDPYLRRLYQRLDLFPTHRDTIFAMAEGTHALVMSETYMKFLILETLKQEDGYYTMEETVSSIHMVWFFPKHTPWKSKFDQGIRQLSRFGLIQHWYRVYTEEWVKVKLGRRYRGASGADGATLPLSLRHLQGVFYILGLVWVAGGVVFLLELLTHRHKDSLAAVWRLHLILQ